MAIFKLIRSKAMPQVSIVSGKLPYMISAFLPLSSFDLATDT